MCGMAPIPGCVESTNGIIGWLNANAGAITGIATAALAGLTWRYVVLTKRLADAAVDHAESVQFKDAPGGRGTEIRVVLQYNPPGGMATRTPPLREYRVNHPGHLSHRSDVMDT